MKNAAAIVEIVKSKRMDNFGLIKKIPDHQDHTNLATETALGK